MEGLDYHDLLAFWAVVREGSMAGAAGVLHVGRPAVSMRVKNLETALGRPLFRRRGRHLELTETGDLVFEYADDIFRLGRELWSATRAGGEGGRRAARLRVGVVQSLPKLVAASLLEPALAADPVPDLECRQGRPDELLAELGAHRLDVVLTDAPPAAGSGARARAHLLVESAVGLFAPPAMAPDLADDFPRSLARVPLVVPTRDQSLRRLLDAWLEREGLAPRVVGEFDDSALLKVFGAAGRGAFPSPTAVAAAIEQQYGVRLVVELPGVRERFYAVTGQRRLQHPAVERLVRAARAAVAEPPAGGA